MSWRDTLKSAKTRVEPLTDRLSNHGVFHPENRTSIAWMAFGRIWVGLILLVWMISANTFGLFGELPSLQVLENPKSEVASEIYSADGVLLGKYFRSNRTPIDYKDINPNVLNALVATEDIRFEEHSGIDLTGTLSIVFYLLKGDKRGASTITQQLAKNLFKTRGKDYSGALTGVPILGKGIIKMKEWLTAVRLERSYSKNEIITMYLNTVEYGSNAFGLKVAAETFFSKPQDSLEVHEAAVLVGLLKAPTYYSPRLNPKNSMRRRNTVIEQMEKYRYLTPAEAESYKALPISLAYQEEDHNEGLAPYFRTVAGNYLINWCNEHGLDLYADGLKVYTTIDSRMQRYAEEAVLEHMSEQQRLFFDHWKDRNPWTKPGMYWGQIEEIDGFLDQQVKRTELYYQLRDEYDGDSAKIWKVLRTKRPTTIFTYQGEKDTLLSPVDEVAYKLHFLHCGFMSMEPQTGAVKAWVGGINHKHFKFDCVYQSARQPGSAFKPIVYSTVMAEAGDVYSPCFEVVDAPVTFVMDEETNQTWTPKNAEGEYSGDTLTIRQGLAKSKNSVTAYMMKILGPRTPETVVKYAKNMGITTELEAVPALCLGVFDVTVYDLVGAYSTFANEGVWTEPMYITRIEDRHGNVIHEFSPKRKQVFSNITAYVMLHMLMGGTQERGGTGLGLYRYKVFGAGGEIGTKTGTTQNHSDGWFMGVTPDLVSGCWVGGEHRSIHFRSMQYGQGARLALPIWGKYMEKVYADTTLSYKPRHFDKPDRKLPVELDCKKYHKAERTEQRDLLQYDDKPMNFDF